MGGVEIFDFWIDFWFFFWNFGGCFTSWLYSQRGSFQRGLKKGNVFFFQPSSKLSVQTEPLTMKEEHLA